MVPIYAVDSWLALHFSLTDLKDVSIYINTARCDEIRIAGVLESNFAICNAENAMKPL
jgi:hypothetical protein